MAVLQLKREVAMKVQNVLSQSPTYVTPDTSIQKVADTMRDLKCGVIPIGENDKIQGVVTDRDIVIRAVALGKNPDTPVKEIMSEKVLYCFQDQEVSDILKNMKEQKVHRLVVLDNPEQKRMVGMISLANIAKACNDEPELASELAECEQRDMEASAYCA